MRKDLHIRVTPDLHQFLTAEADRLGLTINAVTILLLQQAREQQEKRHA